jgi:hypothetical protein
MMGADSFKVCSMCRKDVDQGAIVCSHCGSNTNYQYFEEIPYDQIIRERHEIRVNIAAAVSCVITIIAAFIGISFFGLWVGLGIGVITFKVIYGMMGSSRNFGGMDKISIACKGCSHTNIYQWKIGSLDPGNPAFFDCVVCKQRTQVMSSAPVFIHSEPTHTHKGSMDNGGVTPDIVSDSLDH